MKQAEDRGTGTRQRKETEVLYRAMMECIRFYQFRDRDQILKHGLTVAQCHILDALRSGRMNARDLAAALYLEKSTMSRIIGGMEKKGLIRRIPDPKDGRAALVEATAKGTRRYSQVENDILHQYGETFAGYSRREMLRTSRIIQELTHLAQNRLRHTSSSRVDN